MNIEGTKYRDKLEPSCLAIERVNIYLNEADIRYKKDIVLADITYLRTGGLVKVIAYPDNPDKMADLLSFLHKTETTFKIIGATSNLLFLDDVEYTFLVSTSDMKHIEYDAVNKQIIADAGVMLPDLSRFALYQSITGMEGLEGIPGTLGGAVFMNAGAYGCEVKDTLTGVDLSDYSGNICHYTKDKLGLSHRTSLIRQGKVAGIILKCYFSAENGNAQKIERKMELFHAKRHKYQDFLYPNLGSIFSGSLYRALGKRDIFFKYLSATYLLFSYKIKLFRRESPLNRKWLNDIVVKRFCLKYDIQPFSNKTLNCLVNRGQGTDEMVRYIDEINKLTDNSLPVENEVVDGF